MKFKIKSYIFKILIFVLVVILFSVFNIQCKSSFYPPKTSKINKYYTNESGKVSIYDETIGQKVDIITVDQDGDSIENIELTYLSDGEKVLIFAIDESGKYAPGMEVRSYAELGAAVKSQEFFFAKSLNAEPVEVAAVGAIIITLISVALLAESIISLSQSPPEIRDYGVGYVDICISKDQLSDIAGILLSFGGVFVKIAGKIYAASSLATKVELLLMAADVSQQVGVKRVKGGPWYIRFYIDEISQYSISQISDPVARVSCLLEIISKGDGIPIIEVIGDCTFEESSTPQTALPYDTVIPFSTSTCLIMDTSGSMANEWKGGIKIESAIHGANKMVDMIEQESVFSTIENTVSIVSFSDYAYIDLYPGSDYKLMRSKLDELWYTTDGQTNIENALYSCLEVFQDIKTNEYSPNNPKKIAILLSDGMPNMGEATKEGLVNGPMLELIKNNIVLYTVGFGNKDDLDEDLLKTIAWASGGNYYYATDVYNLSKAYVRLRHESREGHIIEDISGVISQGETKELGMIEVTPEMGDLNITLQWPGSSLDLILKDPRGQIVNSNYPNASINTSSNPIYFIIENPIPGNWDISIYGKIVEDINTEFDIICSTSKERTEEPRNNKIYLLFFLFMFIASASSIIIVIVAKNKKRKFFLQVEGRRVPVTSLITIGRSKSNTIYISDKKASRKHAMVERIDKKFLIRDLNSKNGTYVNNVKIMEMILNPADTIKIGKTYIYFLQEK